MADNLIADGALELARVFVDNTISLLKTSLPGAMSAMFGATGPAFADALESGVDSAKDKVVKMLSGSLADLSKVVVNPKLKFDILNLDDTMKELKEKGLAFAFEGTPLEAFIKLNAKIDPDSQKNMADSLTGMVNGFGDILSPLMNGDFLATSGTAQALQALPAVIHGVRESLFPLEQKWKDMNELASSMSIGFDNSSTGALGDLSTKISSYNASLQRAVNQTQQSPEAINRMSKAFRDAGLDVTQLDSQTSGLAVTMGETSPYAKEFGSVFKSTIEPGMEDTTKAATGLSAALMMIRGSGLSESEFAEDVAFYTKQLGVSNEEAAQKVGLMHAAQKGTRLSLAETRAAINESSNALKMFGDTSGAVANTFNKFAKTLGVGKEGLASELLQQITSGIKNLDMSKKAFLAMSSGMGSRGAIGGALEMEEAMASGNQDAINDMVERATNQIEKITGSALLTRQEAISTGKQEQFYMQREMLKQFGLAGNNDQDATVMQETLAKGQRIPIERLNQQQATEEVMVRGRQQMNATTSPFEAAENVAQVNADVAGVEAISKHLSSSTENLARHSEVIERFGKNLTSFLKDPTQFGKEQEREDRLNKNSTLTPAMANESLPEDERRTATELSMDGVRQRDASGATANVQSKIGEELRDVMGANANALSTQDKIRRDSEGQESRQISVAEQTRRDQSDGITTMQSAWQAIRDATQPAAPANTVASNGTGVQYTGAGSKTGMADGTDAFAIKIGDAVGKKVQEALTKALSEGMKPQFDVKVYVGNEQIETIATEAAMKQIKRTTGG